VTAPVAVMFGMLERGHIKRLLPIVAGLTKAGVRAHVFTDSRFREEIEAEHGFFHDLFAGRPLEEADATSVPIPCRYVSFAGHFADAVVSEVEALQPTLIVHDTFAVIGAVVARRLGLPRVNVCVGHNHAPGPMLEILRHDPRVAVSEACWRAVARLREREQMADASPFSYLTTLSPLLNLYCEPAQFLREDERQVFEPLAFVGSLATSTIVRPPATISPFGADTSFRERIYVCVGTIVWRYYETAARGLFEAIREAVVSLSDVTAIVSLGRAKPGAWVRQLDHPRLRVESFVDQWDVLGHASVFITHQGLNSTHEAIHRGVPMIAYPFFADQPMLARRCQELGLAVPLVAEPRGRVTAEDVYRALARVAEERESLCARLRQARQWELDTIAARDQVIARILALLS
jgi:MGT family glycosyltransferase